MAIDKGYANEMRAHHLNGKRLNIRLLVVFSFSAMLCSTMDSYAQAADSACSSVIAALQHAKSLADSSFTYPAPTSSEVWACYVGQAEQGDVTVQEAVGSFLFYGGQFRSFRIARDYGQARLWFAKAAVQEDAPGSWPAAAISALMLGRIFQGGLGVSADSQQALFWYEKSAAKGNVAALIALGDIYRTGQGAPKDYNQAASWYRKAATLGDPSGETHLGFQYFYGEGVPQSYVQALAWFRKAAAQGETNAEDNVGLMYEHGSGVAQDYQQALIWYQKAAAHGNATAQKNLANLEQKLKPSPREAASIANSGIPATPDGGNSVAAQAHMQSVVAAPRVPDVIAMLQAALGKKLTISSEIESQIPRQDRNALKADLKWCNRNRDSDAPPSEMCWHVADELTRYVGLQNAEVELAYQRACATAPLNQGDDAPLWCLRLGQLYERRGDRDEAIAVFLNAPGCRLQLADKTDDQNALCLREADFLLRQQGNFSAERAVARDLCHDYNQPSACQRVNELGGSADVAAATNQRTADAQSAKQARQDEENEWADKQAERRANANAVIGELRSLPGGNDPNAIVDTANQQAANMIALGAANDAARRQAAERRGEQAAVQQVQANAQEIAQEVANGTLTPQQAMQQIQQQAQQAAQQQNSGTRNQTTGTATGGVTCAGFPAFITGNQVRAHFTGENEQTQYFDLSIQFNTPGNDYIVGGQVGMYQGAKLNPALQAVGRGDTGVEMGEGDTSVASGNFSNGMVVINAPDGSALVGSFVTLSNGAAHLTYYGYIQASVPNSFALTLKEDPSSCGTAGPDTGAGTLN